MNLPALREVANEERRETDGVHIHTCLASGCLSANSQAVHDSIEDALEKNGNPDGVRACGVGCLRLCSQGPLVSVTGSENDKTMYGNVTPEQAASIVAGVHGEPVDAEEVDLEHPFFTRQHSIVLENSGKVEPDRIESYVAMGGYESLYHVLHEMAPEDVVDEVTRSGLRGRGGAGFPAGIKWATVAKHRAAQKYVVCNADEGDPGAFMDRSVLESDPHRVLEGMAIAAYAVGATQAYVYVRGEYPLAIKRLTRAIRQARRLGVLGTQVFESHFDFRVDIRVGAGAFVCGEETALIASIEGTRGTPKPRPPFPAESGIWGQPTLINNVETLANIVPIIREGAEWFAGIGTEKSPGTKVFAVAGKANRTGLIEVPMGSTLREIVHDMAGGVPNGRAVKAVQTGGPSGGCIPASALDTPVDYESLAAVGSIMGSGGMIVMDDEDSMVDVARFFMEFCMDESCGKCVPCRVGTVQLHRMLSKLLDGTGTMADVAALEQLSDVVRNTSLCGLGQTAPNPVLSTLRHFPEEYEAAVTRQPVGATNQ
ncbi:NADH-quinone oxidoreductase subunit NuoF [Candidatus Poribacteria bacterium]|jgi:bidirectional [NiFe] hydrogenase diaphorase subunit|nr:NADH-quinone oxidoreductase subunit NuoF [Candidatus Poribacteria bacterium]MBT5532588.1 NADH-quinone oxidoreductase subunit NuoF [Candidatus Poribacteria bacterium]MBT5710683.1 NADH-quinone oxidoreductase subunit NuoF [Candidatus Poribacteria bacterium]MBT7101866.1 NADH-quinone oxidoreductase subunit NuoF [Candidatus Poribacteria bacterium]MBT7805051.1 NADH-quinone oxidoreductase subunit NuoF [Candidatus Poribacteria bacterium]